MGEKTLDQLLAIAQAVPQDEEPILLVALQNIHATACIILESTFQGKLDFSLLEKLANNSRDLKLALTDSLPYLYLVKWYRLSDIMDPNTGSYVLPEPPVIIVPDDR